MDKVKERLKNGIPESHYYFLLDWKDKNLSEYKKLNNLLEANKYIPLKPKVNPL